MKMTNEEYTRFVKERSPKSKLGGNMLRAFISGGIICCAGQAFVYMYSAMDFPQKQASTAASVTLVFISVLLTALGIYEKLAKFGGAGTLVPITGFANSVAAPALEYKSEGYITGMAVKLFSIAGPVLVFGISASVIYGIILAVFG
ncbi:MAG: SpoVA/SpoVAEb family sporulation membrane protein [Clostridiales bacterium]|jgi:stage V sporulation protein AC|nr:SpoVA/SpoVAEb family sporulation membrane protein [Clostridiales bacterium]